MRRGLYRIFYLFDPISNRDEYFYLSAGTLSRHGEQRQYIGNLRASFFRFCSLSTYSVECRLRYWHVRQIFFIQFAC